MLYCISFFGSQLIKQLTVRQFLKFTPSIVLLLISTLGSVTSVLPLYLLSLRWFAVKTLNNIKKQQF